MKTIKLFLLLILALSSESALSEDFKYYIKHQEGVWSELVIYKNNDSTFVYIVSSSSKASACPIKAKIDNHTQIALYQSVYSVIEEATFDSKEGSLKLQKVGNKIIITDFYIPEYCGLFTDMSGTYSPNNKEKRIILTEYFGKSSLTELIRTINKKTYLFKNDVDTKKTKMYLIKGDKVTLLDEKTDDSGQKWYFINYKGKKELNMWIKAEAIDLEPKAETNQKQEPATQTRLEPPKFVEVVKQALDKSPPKNAEVIKTATGSISLAFLSTLLGLIAWRQS